MKKITIILLLIVVLGISVFAQTKLNTNKLVGFDFSNTFMLDKNYSQNHFLRGWNWGFGEFCLSLYSKTLRQQADIYLLKKREK